MDCTAVEYSFLGKKVGVTYGDECLYGVADHIEGNFLVLMQGKDADEPVWISLKFIDLISEK